MFKNFSCLVNIIIAQTRKMKAGYSMSFLINIALYCMLINFLIENNLLHWAYYPFIIIAFISTTNLMYHLFEKIKAVKRLRTKEKHLSIQEQIRKQKELEKLQAILKEVKTIVSRFTKEELCFVKRFVEEDSKVIEMIPEQIAMVNIINMKGLSGIRIASYYNLMQAEISEEELAILKIYFCGAL